MPEVPTLIKVSAPSLANSSTAIAVEGPPIPVEVTDTCVPWTLPVYVLCSLFSGLCLDHLEGEHIYLCLHCSSLYGIVMLN